MSSPASSKATPRSSVRRHLTHGHARASELARWFIQGVRRGGQFFLDRWQPPTFDDAWYARVSADPRSFVIADRFVREQLPQDRDGFGDDFPNKLDRIATGLTPAFLAAARKLVTSGFDRNVGAVAAGAVRDLDGYEQVLEASLDELAGHPARRLLDLADSERLPKTVLDELGHIRFRTAVQGWLNDKIAKD